MLNIVLFQPEIPPNTGNIIRLASNSGCQLHLIKPLGFDMDAKSLRRAGLDYHEYCALETYENWNEFIALASPSRIFALSTKGTVKYCDAKFEEGDFMIFGPETRGLPDEVLTHKAITEVLTLPMMPNSRSLNLSNTVAIAVYEAWRQLEFSGTA